MRRRRRPRRVIKREPISPYERGHLFEDVVARYFQLLGYAVEKNVKKVGISGAVHEIDVLISKDNIIGVVEAKNYSKPIPKEWIMKASSVAKDIGATEVYVVSASGFTEDARRVAEILNVKLLNLEDMIRELRRNEEIEKLEHYYVKPLYEIKEAEEYASRFIERKLLFKPVEEVREIELYYYPFYVFEAEYSYEDEKGRERRVKFNLLVSAFSETIPVLEEDSVYLMPISAIDKYEYELLEVLNSFEEPVSVSDLEEELRLSRQRISTILTKLVDKGLVDYEEEEDERGRVTRLYYSTIPKIDELIDVYETLVPEHSLREGLPPENKNTVEPKIPSKNLSMIVTSIYKNIKLQAKGVVYIPIYRAKLVSIKDRTYRYIYLVAASEEPILLEGLPENK